MRFEKKAQYRVDKPDYSERAVTEALVNALIHRDYLVMGSEVHIDMYDDRLEIYSPGGMYRGKPIQECGLDEIDYLLKAVFTEYCEGHPRLCFLDSFCNRRQLQNNA